MRDAGIVKKRDQCLIIDCRGFQDPSHGDRRHLGMHFVNLFNLRRHAEFSPMMAHIRMKLKNFIRGGGSAPLPRPWQSNSDSEDDDEIDRMVVVFYCRKGAHRSVAFGIIVQHCLQYTLPKNTTLLPILHLSKEAGVWNQDYCGECYSCRSHGDDKTEPRVKQYVVVCVSIAMMGTS